MQESDEVTFTCVAKGRPTLNIVWLFNGNDLQDDIFGTFKISGSVALGDQVTSTLTVTQARDIHSGEITCMATNRPVTLEETFTATSTAILTVLCELSIKYTSGFLFPQFHFLSQLAATTEFPRALESHWKF